MKVRPGVRNPSWLTMLCASLAAVGAAHADPRAQVPDSLEAPLPRGHVWVRWFEAAANYQQRASAQSRLLEDLPVTLPFEPWRCVVSAPRVHVDRTLREGVGVIEHQQDRDVRCSARGRDPREATLQCTATRSSVQPQTWLRSAAVSSIHLETDDGPMTLQIGCGPPPHRMPSGLLAPTDMRRRRRPR